MVEWKISKEPVGYEEALAFMDERVAGIHAGTAQDCVWLLEHPPIYTAGTSAKESDLLDPRFPVYETGRGGEYTYHGPGQRIAYVMLDLKRCGQGPDVKAYVCDLEQWIINTLQVFGITGERREGRVGIWVSGSPHPGPLPGGERGQSDKKIAALGVRVRHWITLHGVSINLSPDLEHFSGIVPCGIDDAGVTSLAELGVNISMEELDLELKKQFKSIFV